MEASWPGPCSPEADRTAGPARLCQGWQGPAQAMSQPEQVGSRAEPGGAEQGAPLVQLGEQEAARRPAAEPGGTTAGVKSSGKNSSVSPAVNPCPADWLCYQNECYYLSEQENNWNSSQRDCSSRKASLFVPKNQQELQFITKITKQDPWIGLHKKGEDFFWVNGTAMNKNLWQVKGSGECAYIESEEISFSGCSLTRNWVCKKTHNMGPPGLSYITS
ncbi:C-type lectin domain family 2 member L isoform X2 [Alligator mississippiensis]|uniref:C-type lectin domain family 2 member L isoform X2 n=1 Tax=Alligator mississippiensis TaxID=8496 RepID=UPI0009076FC1|nr:C-type lectin domain family 2 member L isoform X2 [Alligator mississippiensis]